MSRRKKHSGGTQTNIALVGQSNKQLAANIGVGVGVGGVFGDGLGQYNDQLAANSASIRQSNR